ncbi:MAG: 2'-5' RNA ligase family protein, partial [Nanoarchaeota archaeon]
YAEKSRKTLSLDSGMNASLSAFLASQKSAYHKKRFRRISHDIRKEEREDVPHVTLLRVKSGRKQGKLQHLLQKVQKLRFGKMMIDRVVLYESHLLPEGPVYKVVKEFTFGAQ